MIETERNEEQVMDSDRIYTDATDVNKGERKGELAALATAVGHFCWLAGAHP